MHGLRLSGLIAHYLALPRRSTVSTSSACRRTGSSTDQDERPSDRIAAALGPDYRVVARRQLPRPGVRPRQPDAGLCRARGRAPAAARSAEAGSNGSTSSAARPGRSTRCWPHGCVRDGAGPASPPPASTWTRRAATAHRATQVEAIAAALQRPRPALRLRGLRRHQRLRLAAAGRGALDRLLAPLATLGAVDPGNPPHPLLRPAERAQASRTGPAFCWARPVHRPARAGTTSSAPTCRPSSAARWSDARLGPRPGLGCPRHD